MTSLLAHSAANQSLTHVPGERVVVDAGLEMLATIRNARRSRTWAAAQDLAIRGREAVAPSGVASPANDVRETIGEESGASQEVVAQRQVSRRAQTWSSNAPQAPSRHGQGGQRRMTLLSWASSRTSRTSRTSRRRGTVLSTSSTHTEELMRGRAWCLYDDCFWEMASKADQVSPADGGLNSQSSSSLPPKLPSGSALEVAAVDLESQQPVSPTRGQDTLSVAVPSPCEARSWRYLALATVGHILFNFGNSGGMAVPGCVWPALRQQAGGGEHVSSVLLATSAIGNFVGVAVGGFAMDRFPAHLVAFCVACGLGLNLALLPYKQGLAAVALSNAVIYFGIGIVDCSYSALIWAAAESRVTRTGPYLVAKALGSELGCMAAALIATWTATLNVGGTQEASGIATDHSQGQNNTGGYDYSVLAYTFGVLCSIGGVALVILPSPKPPVVEAIPSLRQPLRPDCSASGAMATCRVWKERLIVCIGAFMLMTEMAVQIAAMTLLADSVSAEMAHDVLILFYALSSLTLMVSILLARVLPPAEALAILFSIGTLGCAGMAVFYVTGGGCVALLWVSYGCLCATVPTFSLTFSLIASLADVSGKRSAVLSCGAALGPLATAALAVTSPGTLWLGFTALVIVNIAGVLVLRRCSAAPQQAGAS